MLEELMYANCAFFRLFSSMERYIDFGEIPVVPWHLFIKFYPLETKNQRKAKSSENILVIYKGNKKYATKYFLCISDKNTKEKI